MSDQKSDKAQSSERTYRIQDPEQLTSNLLKLFQEGGRALTNYLEKSGEQSGPFSAKSEASQATKALGNVVRSWVSEPTKFAESQSDLLRDYVELWGRSVQKVLGNDVEPVAAPAPGDNRFKDSEWSENAFFDFWKQAYLLTSRWAEDVVEETPGLDEHTKKQAEFYLQQIASALSPSNFILTNPEIMRETLASNGENLVRGMAHLADDLQNTGELFKIAQTDVDAFEVGKNLAVTPGKIVFQNDLIQLIQYEPSTPTVYTMPLLMIPPWINKFYILDLVPEKSFIAWAVSQGFTVFTISWVNPDETFADKSFEDYMTEGLLEAVGAVINTTGQKQINALGCCVVGTLLSATLAYMAATNDNRIKSATFLTTQTDFKSAGDLLVFIDDSQLNALEEMMAEHGFLDGSRMAAVFNALRPKDLIWPYIVNNYLLGKKPVPFDLLYWNQDSTRLPAANHLFYLREFYQKNNLATGNMKLCGQTLDLSKVKMPIYELATKDDHIAPAQSVFTGAALFGGPVKFVLSGSGHIAGVVNPPQKKKYQYWTSRKHEEAFDDWLESATMHEGSWWPDWATWLEKRSGEQTEPRDPSKGKSKPIEDAPGSYVLQRS